jgi:hypothetical protein
MNGSSQFACEKPVPDLDSCLALSAAGDFDNCYYDSNPDCDCADPPPGLGIPTLTGVGIVALSVVLLGSGVWMVISRRRRARVGV